MGWFSRLMGGESKRQLSEVYVDLRAQILGMAQEGVSGGTTTAGPLAVMMDVGAKEHCYTFVAVADGALSLYFSNGGGVIGAGENPKLGAAAREFVEASGSVVSALEPATEFPLPSDGRVALYLVNAEGVWRAEENEKDLSEGRSRLSHWFHEIHRMIALIRRVSELRERETPLVMAAALDDVEEAERQLEGGADPQVRSSEGQPVLAVACSAGSLGVAKLLMDAGADVNAATSLGSGREMPLVCETAAQDRPEVLALLLAAGANVEAQGPSGLTALHLACYLGNTRTAEQLIDAGANVEARQAEGYTPLMMAANAQQEEAVELLLRKGADANAEDNDQSTPIMFAAQHGHSGIVRALLAAGADVQRRGKHGLSAFDFSEQNGHAEVKELLSS